MPISIVNKLNVEDVALQNYLSTPPITTVTGRVYILCIQVFHYPEAPGSDIVSISSAGGVTWAKATSMQLAGLYPVEVWYGYCTTGSTGVSWTVNFGTTPGTYSSRLYHIDEVSGTANTGIIVQNNTLESTTSPITATLSGFSQSSNVSYIYCLCAGGGDQSITPEAGYSTAGNIVMTSFNMASKTIYKAGEDVTPSFTFDGSGPPTSDILALEIKSDGSDTGIPNSLMLMGCGR